MSKELSNFMVKIDRIFEGSSAQTMVGHVVADCRQARLVKPGWTQTMANEPRISSKTGVEPHHLFHIVRKDWSTFLVHSPVSTLAPAELPYFVVPQGWGSRSWMKGSRSQTQREAEHTDGYRHHRLHSDSTEQISTRRGGQEAIQRTIHARTPRKPVRHW